MAALDDPVLPVPELKIEDRPSLGGALATVSDDNDKDLMYTLRENGADVNNMIETILKSGVDVNYMWTSRLSYKFRRSRAGTPMCRYLIEMAAVSSDLAMVKYLISRGARLDITNALHAAAAGSTAEDEDERVKIIEFLLEKGMDINRLEFAGEEEFPNQYWSRAYGTPLHYAAAWGWAGIVECLLKHGADPSIESFCYNTKVHCGTALDWQKYSEPDEGEYSRRVLVLLGDKNAKM